MRDPLHWLDVKRKLALTFVGICLIAFGVGGSLAATSASNALEEEILVRLRYQGRAWADALDADLRLLTRRCEDFASDGYIRQRADSAIAGEATDRAAARDDLRRHLAANKLPLVPAFVGLEILDPRGERVADAGSPEPYPDAAALRLPGDLAAPRHSGLLATPGGAGAPLQAIAVPLRSLDGGRGLGLLVAWVRTERWIADALAAAETGGPRRDEAITLVVSDPAGREVTVERRPGGGVSKFGFRSAADGPGGDGAAPERSTIAVGLPLGADGWEARVRLTSPGALAPVAGLQSRFLFVGIALAAAIGALLFFPMRFLAKPLVELREAARRLQEGDLAIRVATESEDEIGDLARSFNHMAESVESRTLRLEEAAHDLARERDRLDGVIASMNDGVVVLDADGRTVLSNAAAGPLLERIAARDPGFVSHAPCDANPERGGACSACLLDVGRAPRTCVVDAGGRVLEVRAAPIASGGGGRRGRVLVARDITDRIARDEHEIHQERLSVLGEVAAVMAHELNNPLASIRLFAQMAEQDLPPASPLREHMEVIRRNSDTCKRTIRSLLDYATGGAAEPAEVDVRDVLADSVRFLRPLAERSRVRLGVAPSDAPAIVLGDEIQLRQVFVNLLVNAVQAAGHDGGDVTLSVRNDDAHVIVDVADTGPGIPADIRERIFDAFFTTKERGSGTGLGLPTARRIAELHGGGLELVASAPGATSFRVRLRRAQRDVPGDAADAPAGAAA